MKLGIAGFAWLPPCDAENACERDTAPTSGVQLAANVSRPVSLACLYRTSQRDARDGIAGLLNDAWEAEYVGDDRPTVPDLGTIAA